MSVNRKGTGAHGARDVDGGKAALVQEKAMLRTADIDGEAHDLAAIIDPEGIRPRGARDVNSREGEREGCRCADQKSEERRESRELTPMIFFFRVYSISATTRASGFAKTS